MKNTWSWFVFVREELREKERERDRDCSKRRWRVVGTVLPLSATLVRALSLSIIRCRSFEGAAIRVHDISVSEEQTGLLGNWALPPVRLSRQTADRQLISASPLLPSLPFPFFSSTARLPVASVRRRDAEGRGKRRKRPRHRADEKFRAVSLSVYTVQFESDILTRRWRCAAINNLQLLERRRNASNVGRMPVTSAR